MQTRRTPRTSLGGPLLGRLLLNNMQPTRGQIRRYLRRLKRQQRHVDRTARPDLVAYCKAILEADDRLKERRGVWEKGVKTSRCPGRCEQKNRRVRFARG